ncbi:hypothetical protein B7P43_G06919 [Cryptotermes secundus]|uniref:Uncharacterized protein n=1 Tax=Cryptotermes secundus TaxID=105785 RepID=A0A2J7RNY2_9NEOP|nr:hypothetical protein B7P43_G06919 [Cryptotermes secundus]
MSEGRVYFPLELVFLFIGIDELGEDGGFFRWNYLKSIVYQVKISELEHLKARIRDAVAMVTPNVLQAWIFVVPQREPTFKFTEKVIYAEKKNFDSFPL